MDKCMHMGEIVFLRGSSSRLLMHDWWSPFLATFVVSIIPIGILLAMPLASRLLDGRQAPGKRITRSGKKSVEPHPRLPLNAMMCFAAGSLLADALEHIVEEAKEGNAETVCTFTLAGIVIFFVIDRMTRLVHRHDSSHSSSSVGYLSLIADAVHNFTDGLAISASFAKSRRSGLATTTAIFMHEIPHELGDYALLSKSGFSHSHILWLQVMTAGAAFAGTAVGLVVEWGALAGTGPNWLLPLTCGGFLYLGLCTILPEVLGDQEAPQGPRQLLVDAGALLGGIAVLQLLEAYF